VVHNFGDDVGIRFRCGCSESDFGAFGSDNFNLSPVRTVELGSTRLQCQPSIAFFFLFFFCSVGAYPPVTGKGYEAIVLRIYIYTYFRF